MSNSIREIIERGKQYLKDKEYSNGAIRLYNDGWRRFEKFCKDKNITEPTRIDGDTFLASRGISLNDTQKGWHIQQKRHISCLFDIWEYGKSSSGSGRKTRYPLPACFADIFGKYNEFLDTRGLSEKTIYCKGHYAKKLLHYLESVGISDVNSILKENIYDYLSLIESKQTKSEMKFFLREFLGFLVDTFNADCGLAMLFPVILESKMSSLPSVYSAEELRMAYECLGTTSRCAKRERAVFLLALQLGMRASDVTQLKFENIDWRLQKLSFIQWKTKRNIVLPLPDECMFALLDYIKNERPKKDDPHIFLTTRAPYTPLCGSNYHYFVSNCYKRAGVDTKNKHRGLHSVRHSMAVNMLLTDTPYPVITGILGHESSNTTKAYLRVDTERLRVLCLEVPYGS